MSEKDRARMNTDKKRGTILTLVNNTIIADLNHKCKHMDVARHVSSTLSRNCLNDFKNSSVFFFLITTVLISLTNQNTIFMHTSSCFM